MFENPWVILGLVVLCVLLRLAAEYWPRLPERLQNSLRELADAGLLAGLLVFFILRPFVAEARVIPSSSMEPTLEGDERTPLTNDRILVNKFIYRFINPACGDIVVFKPPPAAHRIGNDYIKRCIGLPGDKILVRDGQVFRNGRPLPEPYVASPPDYVWPPDGQPATVPQHCLLVFGDNRGNSNDSHAWGYLRPDNTFEPHPFLPRENVRGKAVCIFWPPSRLRWLTDHR
jgi:signal peptidase I